MSHDEYRETVLSDMDNHALDVREAADAVRHFAEKKNESEVRAAAQRVLRYAYKLMSDLSTLDYIATKEREEKAQVESDRARIEADQAKLPL